jgi:hypothetical protein
LEARLILSQTVDRIANRFALVLEERKQTFALLLDQGCIHRHGPIVPLLPEARPLTLVTRAQTVPAIGALGATLFGRLLQQSRPDTRALL